MRYDETTENNLPTKGTKKTQAQAPNGTVTIHDVHILDSSSSMKGGKYDAALKGINEDIKASKELFKVTPGLTNTMSIVEFGNHTKIVNQIWMQPIAEVNEFSSKNFYSSTALFQAIGQTIEKLLKDKKKSDKVLMKIFTDGEENDSQGTYGINYPYGFVKTSKALSDLMEKVQKEDNFTITFVGTKRDTDLMVQNLHVDASNTLVHDNTPASVMQSFSKTVAARTSYIRGASAGEDVSRNFYSKILK